MRSVGKWREGGVRMVLGHSLGRRVPMSGRAERWLCGGLGCGCARSGCGYELHSELASFAFEGGEFTLLAAAVKFFHAPIYPYLSFGEQSIIETGQNARHCLDPF